MTQSTGAISISEMVIPYSKSVNPRDVIAGALLKRGYIVLDQIDERFRDETIIANYGESGKREVLIGYVVEIILQFISAKTGEVLCTTTAERYGDTEATDIKQAIHRALNALFSEDADRRDFHMGKKNGIRKSIFPKQGIIIKKASQHNAVGLSLQSRYIGK